MSESPRIAVLMTCHNRRATTLVCLATLRSQRHFREADLYLVDDGSSDGTGEAVRAAWPGANVIDGDGSLFWNGGMNRAWEEAVASGVAYDYFFWLNDDVLLDPGALERMVADARMVADPHEPLVLAGATLDAAREHVTYGAHVRPDPRRPLRMTLLRPNQTPQMAATASGNAVLVSRPAFERLGMLDPRFEHIYGDLDYGLRAEAEGIPVMLAGEPVGTCEANANRANSLDPALGRWERLCARWRESGKVHARDWRRMVAKHDGGPIARLRHRIAPYLRILFDRPNRSAGSVPLAPIALK